jgi:hypothetical protein
MGDDRGPLVLTKAQKLYISEEKKSAEVHLVGGLSLQPLLLMIIMMMMI